MEGAEFYGLRLTTLASPGVHFYTFAKAVREAMIHSQRQWGVPLLALYAFSVGGAGENKHADQAKVKQNERHLKTAFSSPDWLFKGKHSLIVHIVPNPCLLD